MACKIVPINEQEILRRATRFFVGIVLYSSSPGIPNMIPERFQAALGALLVSGASPATPGGRLSNCAWPYANASPCDVRSILKTRRKVANPKIGGLRALKIRSGGVDTVGGLRR